MESCAYDSEGLEPTTSSAPQLILIDRMCAASYLLYAQKDPVLRLDECLSCTRISCPGQEEFWTHTTSRHYAHSHSSILPLNTRTETVYEVANKRNTHLQHYFRGR